MNIAGNLRRSVSTSIFTIHRMGFIRWRGFYAVLLLSGLTVWPAHALPPNVLQNPGFFNNTVDTWAQGYDIFNHVQYHPQVTAYFCGAGTMEMELDCTAVRSQNNILDLSLGAGVNGANPGPAVVDGAPRQCFPMQYNWPPIVFQNNGGGNFVKSGFQTFCYGLVHGLNTYNGLTYVNPFYRAGLGTSLDDLQVGLNLMDSQVYTAAGPHTYISYNILNPDWANRTIADGLAQLGIPAAVTVEHGAHWVCVVGVETDVAPVANGAYKIYGFFVDDPWTGYQEANPFGPNGQLLPPGLAEEKFCSTRINPNRLANDELWAALFNLAGGPPLPLYGYGLGYKFEVEPVGPIALDTGNGGEYTSIPAPSPILPNAPITASNALFLATNEMTGDSFVEEQPGLTNGTWDLADATLVQYPTDGPNEGDWLVPYDGSGGVNDVTGFLMIDEETGDIDEAVWMNPGDAVPSMTLAQIDAMETDEYDDIVPDDNAGEAQLNIQVGVPYNNFNNTNVILSWSVDPLLTNMYSVQVLGNLLESNWMTLTNVPIMTNGQFQMSLPATGPPQFYRLYFTSTNTPPPATTNSD